MFASIWRRRLLGTHQILGGGGGGGGGDPLRIILGTIPFAHTYSSSAVADLPNSEPCPATVSYLISCGLSPAGAAVTATTKKIRILSTEKADAVRALLRDHGFDDNDIVRTVRSAPTILLADPERVILPKIQFFASLGFEPRKLATAPLLLTRSLDEHLVPSIQFLRGVIGSEDDLRLGFSRAPRALLADVEKDMRPVVEALRRCGFTDAAISELLVTQMGVLLTSPDRISEVFEQLKAIGMCISDPRFMHCFREMCRLKKDAWLRKLALYQSFGLSEGEVLEIFKAQPMILQFGNKNMEKKVRFLLDELKLGTSFIIAHPEILCSGLNECILPRCAVLFVLMREGKIQRGIELVEALLVDSSVFSERYVLSHADDVPDVVKAYEGEIRFQGFR
ncbi:transcription termination factor MTERF8, chloroplastic-like [Lolium rigidum]|uniref:transcription termination factor MTERF8, chloroplastic-like n=1 Tax=Lolium rigidum TaxID=89674 RepID=UPI001F5D6762|nr:transcription termination factor MTERF8, chloroplastic-like [Lolium rigidum]